MAIVFYFRHRMKNNPSSPDYSYPPLIEDLLENLEMEQSLNHLLEAIEERRNDDLSSDIMHLYWTSLFAMYVNYRKDTVRVSATLACHGEDMELALDEFLDILRRAARHEQPPPIFYEDRHTDTLIHLYHNPKMRIRIHRRESDPGFFK